MIPETLKLGCVVQPEKILLMIPVSKTTTPIGIGLGHDRLSNPVRNSYGCLLSG